jgi:DNA-binding transcriptional regulator LsrR (DeoR family)
LADLIRKLRAELRAECETEVERTLRVWVCAAHGLSRAEIADKLGLTQTEVRHSLERARGVADRIG